MSRAGTLAAVISASLFFGLVTPAAAAPAHDEITGAKNATMGEVYRTSNATATDGLDDPRCEWSTLHKTVWFRFRASRNIDVVARALPLDGTDVEMAIFRSSTEGLSLIACDDYGWDGEEENIRFHTSAGADYFIMLGSATPAQSGGRIRFDIHRPLKVAPKLDDVAWTKRANGDAVITGRVRCSTRTRIQVEASLSQTGTTAEGGKGIDCSGDRSLPWMLPVDRFEGDAFHRGGAALSVQVFYDPDSVTVSRAKRTRLISCSRIGSVGDDRMYGSGGRDTLCGLYGNDTLVGRGGIDVLIGYNGNDDLSGGGKADQLDGGRGRDLLRGGAGRDLLLGRDGDDDLRGGGARDTCRGGPGRDRHDSCERR